MMQNFDDQLLQMAIESGEEVVHRMLEVSDSNLPTEQNITFKNFTWSTQGDGGSLNLIVDTIYTLDQKRLKQRCAIDDNVDIRDYCDILSAGLGVIGTTSESKESEVDTEQSLLKPAYSSSEIMANCLELSLAWATAHHLLSLLLSLKEDITWQGSRTVSAKSGLVVDKKDQRTKLKEMIKEIKEVWHLKGTWSELVERHRWWQNSTSGNLPHVVSATDIVNYLKAYKLAGFELVKDGVAKYATKMTATSGARLGNLVMCHYELRNQLSLKDYAKATAWAQQCHMEAIWQYSARKPADDSRIDVNPKEIPSLMAFGFITNYLDKCIVFSRLPDGYQANELYSDITRVSLAQEAISLGSQFKNHIGALTIAKAANEAPGVYDSIKAVVDQSSLVANGQEATIEYQKEDGTVVNLTAKQNLEQSLKDSKAPIEALAKNTGTLNCGDFLEKLDGVVGALEFLGLGSFRSAIAMYKEYKRAGKRLKIYKKAEAGKANGESHLTLPNFVQWATDKGKRRKYTAAYLGVAYLVKGFGSLLRLFPPAIVAAEIIVLIGDVGRLAHKSFTVAKGLYKTVRGTKGKKRKEYASYLLNNARQALSDKRTAGTGDSTKILKIVKELILLETNALKPIKKKHKNFTRAMKVVAVLPGQEAHAKRAMAEADKAMDKIAEITDAQLDNVIRMSNAQSSEQFLGVACNMLDKAIQGILFSAFASQPTDGSRTLISIFTEMVNEKLKQLKIDVLSHLDLSHNSILKMT